MEAFVRACSQGNIEEVRSLLALLEQEGKKEEAIINGLCHLEFPNVTSIAEVLLDGTAVDLNRTATFEGHHKGQTPLTAACDKVQPGLARLLLSQPGVDPNQRDEDGNMPLAHVHDSSHLPILKVLLEDARTDPALRDVHGVTVLGRVVSNHTNESVLALLLQDPRVDPNQAMSSGSTPLDVACETLDFWAAGMLLKHPRIDPNVSSDGDGYTPLLGACHSQSTTLVRLLLEHPSVDPNLADEDGNTPLLVACLSRVAALVHLLLDDARVDRTRPNKCGTYPLTVICQEMPKWHVEDLVRAFVRGPCAPQDLRQALVHALRRNLKVALMLIMLRWDGEFEPGTPAVAEQAQDWEEDDHPGDNERKLRLLREFAEDRTATRRRLCRDLDWVGSSAAWLPLLLLLT